jgi:hypothetical protein
MQRIESSQIARSRQCARGRLHPPQKPLGYGHRSDHPGTNVFKKQIPPDRRIRRSYWSFANLAMRQAGHLRNTNRRRIETVRTTCEFPDLLSIRLVLIALADIGSIEIRPQVRSCSRIRPLSIVSGPPKISASRSGMRGLGLSEIGRISATGTPRFSMMKDSPATTCRTISLVFRWISRTVEDFMCHTVTHSIPV